MSNLLPSNTDFISLVKHACDDMAKTVKGLKVLNPSDAATAISLWKRIRDWQDHIETAKKYASEPYKKHLGLISDLAKSLDIPLDSLSDDLRKKIEHYVEESEETCQMLQISDQERSLSTADGVVYEKKNIKYKISDPSLIPPNCMMPDEKKIEKLVKAGVVIPGVDIFEEKTLIMKRK